MLLTKFRQIHRRLKSDLTLSYNENKYLTIWFFNQLVYHKIEFSEKILSDLELEDFFFYNQNGTRGLIVVSKSFVIVCFRGTQYRQKNDLLMVLNFFKSKYYEYIVHSGFVKALSNVKDDVLGDLGKINLGTKKVIFTGHSLGGAIATLLALHFKPDELITFGCPRVFAQEVDDSYKDIIHKRFVISNDLITILPFMWLNYKDLPNTYVLPAQQKSWLRPFSNHGLLCYYDSLVKAKFIYED